jgi:hypothetical protein
MEVALSHLPASFAELQASEAVMLYLPRLQWRAEHSRSLLRQLGFRNVRLEAGVDAALEDARAAAAADGWRFHTTRTDAEVAFSISMLRIWQQVIDAGLPYVVIFEDDVLPHPHIVRVGPEYWDETPRDVDFVFMGNQIDVPQDELGRHPDRIVTLPAYCLHAYVITRAGAVRGLELLREQLEAQPAGLVILDAELRTWMANERIRYACWNGTMLPTILPRSDDPTRSSEYPRDVVWAQRDTGVFFQNFTLGSAMFPDGRP